MPRETALLRNKLGTKRSLAPCWYWERGTEKKKVREGANFKRAQESLPLDCYGVAWAVMSWIPASPRTLRTLQDWLRRHNRPQLFG